MCFSGGNCRACSSARCLISFSAERQKLIGLFSPIVRRPLRVRAPSQSRGSRSTRSGTRPLHISMVPREIVVQAIPFHKAGTSSPGCPENQAAGPEHRSGPRLAAGGTKGPGQAGSRFPIVRPSGRSFLPATAGRNERTQRRRPFLRWPVFTCPVVAGFARPMTSGRVTLSETMASRGMVYGISTPDAWVAAALKRKCNSMVRMSGLADSVFMFLPEPRHSLKFQRSAATRTGFMTDDPSSVACDFSSSHRCQRSRR